MEYWDSYFRTQKKHDYDGWLAGYAAFLPAGGRALDLGCGAGACTQALLGMGMRVTAADFSPAAIAQIRERYPAAQTVCFDMTTRFPFEDEAFDAVAADLSLHYFSWADTQRIAGEIARVLAPGGWLLLRVHSTKNVDPAGLERIEENYYISEGYPRRYFTGEDIHALFACRGRLMMKETTITRFGRTKHVIEAAACKPAQQEE